MKPHFLSTFPLPASLEAAYSINEGAQKIWGNVLVVLSWLGGQSDNLFISDIITASQRSCGKVMFSVVCVCHSVCPQGVHMWPLPLMPWTLTGTPSLSPGPPGYQTSDPLLSPSPAPQEWHLLANIGDLFKLVYLGTPRVTSGGGHWSTYGLQVGLSRFMWYVPSCERQRRDVIFCEWVVLMDDDKNDM